VYVEKRVRHCPLKENMIGRVVLKRGKKSLNVVEEDVSNFYSDTEG
jgi:hypothetical protein